MISWHYVFEPMRGVHGASLWKSVTLWHFDITPMSLWCNILTLWCSFSSYYLHSDVSPYLAEYHFLFIDNNCRGGHDMGHYNIQINKEVSQRKCRCVFFTWKLVYNRIFLFYSFSRNSLTFRRWIRVPNMSLNIRKIYLILFLL